MDLYEKMKTAMWIINGISLLSAFIAKGKKTARLMIKILAAGVIILAAWYLYGYLSLYL